MLEKVIIFKTTSDLVDLSFRKYTVAFNGVAENLCHAFPHSW